LDFKGPTSKGGEGKGGEGRRRKRERERRGGKDNLDMKSLLQSVIDAVLT